MGSPVVGPSYIRGEWWLQTPPLNWRAATAASLGAEILHCVICLQGQGRRWSHLCSRQSSATARGIFSSTEKLHLAATCYECRRLQTGTRKRASLGKDTACAHPCKKFHIFIFHCYSHRSTKIGTQSESSAHLHTMKFQRHVTGWFHSNNIMNIKVWPAASSLNMPRHKIWPP